MWQLQNYAHGVREKLLQSSIHAQNIPSLMNKCNYSTRKVFFGATAEVNTHIPRSGAERSTTN